MKMIIKISAILLVLILCSVLFSKLVTAQQDDVSFQVFYDQLSPYGHWIDYPNYGYAWIPNVGSDFAPYSTEGHWILTDYGWTWVSDYSWGWAPFHYGRWGYDNSYGWLWIPGYEWGPSWVTWRRADGYYGWRPMEPGVSINVSFGREYSSHNDHWMFVRDRDFDRSDINLYYVNRTEHDRIFRNSSVINTTYNDKSRNSTYVSGPGREDVQKVTGRSSRTVAIRENSKPGQDMSNGELRIYRPQITKSNDRNQKPAPSRITNLKDVKRPSAINATSQPKNVNSSGNNKQERQPSTAKTNNVAQPSQPRSANPVSNNRPLQQPSTAKPNNVAQPSQPRSANPPSNNRQVQQPVTAKPNNVAQPSQPRSANPASNNRQVQHQNTPKPQNNNQPKAQPEPAQNSNPSENNKRER